MSISLCNVGHKSKGEALVFALPQSERDALRLRSMRFCSLTAKLAAVCYSFAIMSGTFDQSLAQLKTFEGCVPWMYRDTAGKVTVGVGLMLPDAAAACALPFQTEGAQRRRQSRLRRSLPAWRRWRWAGCHRSTARPARWSCPRR